MNYEEFSKMVDTFLENGFNYFDTAHGYLDGQSEEIFAKFKRCRAYEIGLGLKAEGKYWIYEGI